MGRIVEYTVQLIQAGQRAYDRKWIFLGFFATTFLASVLILGRLGLLPEAKLVTAVEPVTPTATLVPAVVELPTKLEISEIGLSSVITNPITTDIVALDKELLKGAVRYPTSAKLGGIGNVVLFGHSSYLPIVGNRAYKTFNGIQKLVAGDVIKVSSDTAVYTYGVRSVAKERATDNTAIQLKIAGKTLTLVTCNSFGTKEDRFVVTADFVESHPISS